MRSITKQLDMSPGAVSPVVHVSQYDSDFSIVFNLYCTDGNFTIESGTTAEVRGTKKSGTGYSATATVNISAKTVTVTGDKQMTAVAGDNIYEITLYKGSKELNSINFILAVERAAMDQDTVVDETTIREFGELETYIEGVKADAAASASAANASQTAAAQSATNAANSAIEAAQSAQSVDAERLNRIAFGSYVVEESTGPIVHFEDGADNIPMKDVLVHIEPVQAGSGDPSPDNVRPITGWTGAKVTRTGKNLLPPPVAETFTQNGVTVTASPDGSYTAVGTTSGGSFIHQFALSKPITIKNDMYWHVMNDDICVSCSVALISEGKNIKDITLSPKNRIVDLSNVIGKTIDAYQFYVANNQETNITLKPMFVLNSTATAYESYSGETYDITFPSEAGTVYGGTLDVTRGELVVDRAMVTLDGSSDEAWRMSGTGRRFFTDINSIRVFIDAPNSSYLYSGAIANKYKERNSVQSWDGGTGTIGFSIESKQSSFAGRLFVRIQEAVESSTTVEDFTAALATEPLQICFPLVTPIIYQLTPQEITSLLGTNNLWADAGDCEVEYRADTTLYISRLTEPDADMIADANITSGQYFMVGNNLYRATSNIASGASVIVGTNAVKVSLATALNEINQ